MVIAKHGDGRDINGENTAGITVMDEHGKQIVPESSAESINAGDARGRAKMRSEV